jgi:membrane dipeptidase
MRATESLFFALALASATACGEDPARPPRASGTAREQAPAPPSAAPAASSAAALPANAPAPSPAVLLPEMAGAPAADSPPRAFDMHCDTPWQVGFKGRDVALTSGMITPDTLAKGHVGAVFLAIYISDDLHHGKPTIDDADHILEVARSIVDHHPETFALASDGNVPDGAVAAYLSIEGAGAFADDITQIDRFIAKGVRFVGPVHMKDDRLSTSATGKDRVHGLTELGKRFCERVYAGGALVDVSHMSDAGFRDVVAIAKKFRAPIVATHSDARAIADVPRNLTDDELVAIGESDGVAGINFYGKYLRTKGKATLSDAVKQALHMVKVAGIDHVGIGSDFDGSDPPADLADASYYPAFAKALRDAGLSAEDVHKIFSENVKRVLRWKPAKSP